MGKSPKVAVLSVHTSPLDQPGIGDSGGMNVYMRSVAERLAAQGVPVDLFTRCRGHDNPEVQRLDSGARLITIKAGPCAAIPKAELTRYVPEFLGGLLRRARMEDGAYDVVHTHYWLSGWVGRAAKEIWRAPLVASFHTLGKVKNYSRGRGEPPEPPSRLAGEERVIARADRILAQTPAEAAQLVGFYRADPSQIRVIPPGVDHAIFAPSDKGSARRRLHLDPKMCLALYVGRLQPHKGPDIAVRTLAEAVAREPGRCLVLGVVGGPSGSSSGAEVSRLLDLATDLGVGDRLMLFPPQPQTRLADFYSAADAVLVPSRSESFGLVALEAQACGTPVVASAVGGLRFVVEDRVSGYLVEGHDPADHADRLLSLLRDGERARRMGEEGSRRALRFSWDATAARLLSVYREVVERGARGVAAVSEANRAADPRARG